VRKKTFFLYVAGIYNIISYRLYSVITIYMWCMFSYSVVRMVPACICVCGAVLHFEQTRICESFHLCSPHPVIYLSLCMFSYIFLSNFKLELWEKSSVQNFDLFRWKRAKKLHCDKENCAVEMKLVSILFYQYR
jgi:F0F1-type ATP synthase membrane subunit a